MKYSSSAPAIGGNVYPRKIVKCVLEVNAAAVILAHNHPGEHTEPSHADKLITEKLKQALDTVDVRMLDHILVAGASIITIAEQGLIP